MAEVEYTTDQGLRMNALDIATRVDEKTIPFRTGKDDTETPETKHDRVLVQAQRYYDFMVGESNA